MDREITVSYSRELIRFAVWKFWTRSVGRASFVIFVAICIAFVGFFLSGDRSWVLGVLGATIAFSLSIGSVSYFVYLNRSLEKFNRMETPTAKLRFTNERIDMELDIGRSELSWKMIEKIWKYPSVWLVFIAKQGYVTLPTADFDDELKEFIIIKVRENGGQDS